MEREKLISAVSRTYPQASEILVSFPDEWELIETLEQKRGERTSPLYIAAMPAKPERPSRHHFPDLPPEINLSLTSYRLYRFFEPWPTPTILLDWNPYVGQGRVAGQGDMKIRLQDIGDAQAWVGKNVAVIWECFFHNQGRQSENWEDLLAKVWQAVEKSLGVPKIFTPDHEPTMEAAVYREFLGRMFYAPEPASARWWSKSLT